ncbi:MAG: hypothetical protein OXQ94_04500 [Gemmatimonadota bacterium]|nr:hypothetical protein [Gemmatimonadota bacterium]MDE2870934.1 hypothetical protein [Gemmatimonadota bacterium]
MRAGVACGPVVAVLALTAASGCEYADPLELHPDVVTLEVLLITGESEARMLAIHSHRAPGDGGVPEVSAHLAGPGWEAEFSETPELDVCTPVDDLPGTPKCLRAALPEPVRAGVTYGLSGTAPLGSFTGEARVPDPPLMLTDTLRLAGRKYGERLPIRLRYRAGPDIGLLPLDVRNVFETLEDGTEVELDYTYLGIGLREVDPADTAFTVWMIDREKTVRFSLTLLGMGWHYRNFWYDGIRPWPSSGIEGDGVYGYFDGVTRSRATQVLVR